MGNRDTSNMKPNIGVYTNPAHDLWGAPAEPDVEHVLDGSTLKPGEVTIEIKNTGICGSDIHFLTHGRIGPMIVTSDHILGHESAGTILAIHPNTITTLKPGDRVAIEPQIPCHSCTPCLHGHYNGCENVSFLSTPPVPGLLRRYITHPAMWCHKLPDSISFEEGAMLEPLSVALYAVEKSGLRLGDPVLICGAGPIGLVTMLCARAAGAHPIIITDLDAGRLSAANKFVPSCKTFLIPQSGNQTPEDIAKQIVQDLGIEPSIAIECTGSQPSIATAIFAVRFGGTVFAVGVGKSELELPYMRLSTRQVELKFQYRYANTWPRAIRVVEGGLVDLKPLVTHRFGVEDAQEAFGVAGDRASGALKVMIKM
ncbi:N-terminal acetyltransferase A complex catalytic subunit ard1 [Endocarpon pusillum]|uniref:D-xylulose reductase n=1 Tax=Endocarpon pusillum TaxID=364733 RepID=A0A8H7E462_9EURO|nr:N-terminal acetyltransferase A complex catalytic subunit ard1 [Endocarpon pusillum]